MGGFIATHCGAFSHSLW